MKIKLNRDLWNHKQGEVMEIGEDRGSWAISNKHADLVVETDEIVIAEEVNDEAEEVMDEVESNESEVETDESEVKSEVPFGVTFGSEVTPVPAQNKAIEPKYKRNK